MTIKLKITKNYGNEAIYIVDESFNSIHRQLTSHKTISRAEIELYKKIGIKFVVETPEI